MVGNKQITDQLLASRATNRLKLLILFIYAESNYIFSDIIDSIFTVVVFILPYKYCNVNADMHLDLYFYNDQLICNVHIIIYL